MIRIVLICLLLLPLTAVADSYCSGKVNSVGMGRSGTLYLSGPGGLRAVYICSVKTETNNVSTEACKVMYSTLLTAQAQDKSVDVTFNPGIESCGGLQSWKWATNVNWIFLKK